MELFRRPFVQREKETAREENRRAWGWVQGGFPESEANMGTTLGTVGRIFGMATAGAALLFGTAASFRWTHERPAVSEARSSCPHSGAKARDAVRNASKIHRGPRAFVFRFHRA